MSILYQQYYFKVDKSFNLPLKIIIIIFRIFTYMCEHFLEQKNNLAADKITFREANFTTKEISTSLNAQLAPG